MFCSKKAIFSSAASLIICGTCSAASTILHYSLNDTDAAGLPNIPSVGGSAGTAQGTFFGILSSDVPTTGVPAGAGNRSIVGAGSDVSDGINSPTTQELSNTLVTTNGGFTKESWLLWNGGGNVNSVIDYAGTEKFRMNATGHSGLQFRLRLGRTNHCHDRAGDLALCRSSFRVGWRPGIGYRRHRRNLDLLS